MRRSLLLCLLSMAIVLSVSSVVHAQPQRSLPGMGWYSTATIQNVGSATADVNLEVYPQGPGNASTASFTLDVGASKVFVAGGNNAYGTVDVSPSLASGSGSAVIYSGQPVVAIGSIQNNRLSAFPNLGVIGGNAAEFFRGASQAGTSLFYPVVKNNFFGRKTVFFIQAAGSNADITATIRTTRGTTHTRTLPTITANRSVILDPDDFGMARENCGSNVNDSPCFGSLSITSSSGSIVGTYIEFETNQSPAQLVLAASMFANTEADDKIYCPVIKNEFVGRTTGMTIANTSNVTVTVNVTYTVYQVMPGANANVGSTYTESGVTIPANGSVVFSRFNSNIGGMPPGTLAAAVVEGSTNSLVGVVNESNFSGTPVRATAYTCFGDDSATNRLAAPLFKRDVAGVTSALVVQNVGANNVTMRATFKCGTNPPVTVTTDPIAPGSSFNFSGFAGAPRMGSVPFRENCAVTVTVPSGGKIVGIAQETAQFGTVQPNLNTKNYEAFNLPNT